MLMIIVPSSSTAKAYRYCYRFIVFPSRSFKIDAHLVARGSARGTPARKIGPGTESSIRTHFARASFRAACYCILNDPLHPYRRRRAFPKAYVLTASDFWRAGLGRDGNS